VSDLAGLLSTSRFMPHGHCFLWDPTILWLNVASDGVIALSYFSIPVALVTFVRRRADLAFDWIFLLFGAFILLCGATHGVEIATVWNPIYGWQGLVKAVTAGVSLATAVVLWPLVPRALRLPSPSQLEDANARYRSLNRELEERVQMRTKELEEANGSLARANERLARFASFLSHEIRQPLNVIELGIAAIAPDARLLPAEIHGAFERVARASGQMRDLVESELQIARSADRELDWQWIELRDAASAAVDQLAERIAEAGASVDVGPLPAIHGQRTQVRQVFVNLIANSLRYRRPEIALAVRIHEVPGGLPGRCRVAIADNGRGFPSGGALFDPFERGASRDAEGTGLGLAICKRIVEHHGGTIEASGREGEGAVFTIELPVAGTKPGPSPRVV